MQLEALRGRFELPRRQSATSSLALSTMIPGSRLTELGHLSFATFRWMSIFKNSESGQGLSSILLAGPENGSYLVKDLHPCVPDGGPEPAGDLYLPKVDFCLDNVLFKVLASSQLFPSRTE